MHFRVVKALFGSLDNFILILSLGIALDTVLATIIGFWLYYSTGSKPRQNDRTPEDDKTEYEMVSSVLVQLPMYNEREVYDRVIAAACRLNWPRHRLIVQVLDDSSEEDISEGIRTCVNQWQAEGVDIRYRKRTIRKAFKAGNLKEGLSEEYAQRCDFVAILDADFIPSPDWLCQMVPYLEADPELALVQSRWTFCNSSDGYLTLWQEIDLRWHFFAEQSSGSHLIGYFGFNGTAGIWRLCTILEAGGWSGDTLTEDMDLALAAASNGWKFLMLPHVECLSELPNSLTGYRKQQYRWFCGPASLLRKHFKSLWSAKEGDITRRLYMLLLYIGLRRIARPVITLLLWLLASLSVLMPHLVPVPVYSMAAILLVQPLCVFLFSLQHIHLLPGYSLFLSSLSLLKTQAVLSGLLDLPSSRNWIVTQKSGSSNSLSQLNGSPPKRPCFNFPHLSSPKPWPLNGSRAQRNKSRISRSHELCLGAVFVLSSAGGLLLYSNTSDWNPLLCLLIFVQGVNTITQTVLYL